METRILSLEERIEKERDLRERAMKYVHNMLEDLKQTFRDFEIGFARFDGRFTQHIQDDEKTGRFILEINARLRTVERLAWVGVGGVAVIAAIVAIIGGRLLHVLGG